jgi:hypothetical protein
MVTRPYVADDFDAIRQRLEELQRFRQPDVRYMFLNETTIRIWSISDKAKNHWGEKRDGSVTRSNWLSILAKQGMIGEEVFTDPTQ